MKTLEHLIFNLDQSPLSTVPFHSDVEGIDRYFSDTFPLHMAIHNVDRKDEVQMQYTKLHKHDVAEINVIIGTDQLQYRIGLEDKEFVVGANTGIWIPAGVRHSANLVKGKGYFIAIRLDAIPEKLTKEKAEILTASNAE
ncbi:MAG: hypothetical protein AAF149_07685 [Bacteroidota bacterium]